jgi:hypothetical protein
MKRVNTQESENISQARGILSREEECPFFIRLSGEHLKRRRFSVPKRVHFARVL